MKLSLLDFIEKNYDWEEKLSQKPYCLTIKRDGGYILFMYSQIDSDMSNPVVQEARGIIFWEEEMLPVCVPFFKFFNAQEENASKIDWSTAEVQEKLDGSIIKVWYHNGWHVSTSGTIFAENAETQMPITLPEHGGLNIYNYMDLFRYASPKPLEWYYFLDRGYTYIFELVSPYNRIVVPYKESKLYHIGSRNNKTLIEENLDIGIEKPKSYSMSSLEECLQVAENLPFEEEGYVVVDSQYNRVKIKSPAYVIAHHLKNNGVITYSRVLDMIKFGGDDDFISIYPEYREIFKTVKDKLVSFIDDCLEILHEFNKVKFETRKEFAIWATSKKFPSLLFLLLDEKVGRTSSDVSNYILSIESNKLLKMIGVKE